MAPFSVQQYYADKGVDAKPLSEPHCPYDGTVMTIRILKKPDGTIEGGNYYYPEPHTIWKCTKCKAEFVEILEKKWPTT